MKGLLLFEDATSYARDTEQYYNPMITKIDVIVEGTPNQIYSQGLRSYHTWEEAKKLFSSSPSKNKRDPEVSVTEMQLALADVTLPSFLLSKFCIWLDFCRTDDKGLHGNGRKIENASNGLTLQITKTAETTGALNIYLYALMDACLIIENGSYKELVY